MEGDVLVVARVQQGEVERSAWNRNEGVEAWQRRPVVDDASDEVVCDAWVAAEGLEDGEDAEDFVGVEELGEVAEGRDEDYAGVVGGLCCGLGDGVGEVCGEVSGVGVGKVEC